MMMMRRYLEKNSEVDEKVMAAQDPLIVLAKKTLHDASELVSNLADPRRTRS